MARSDETTSGSVVPAAPIERKILRASEEQRPDPAPEKASSLPTRFGLIERTRRRGIEKRRYTHLVFGIRTRVIVSPRYRVAYLRVPKVANTSIRHALEDGRQERIDIRRLRNRYPEHLSFTFVRNPWDRLVSTWSDKIRTEKLNNANFVEGVHKGFVKRGYPMRAGMPFREFAEFACSLSDAKIEKHLKSQCWFIVRNGAIVADFVGRAESISEDWKQLCERVGEFIALGHHKRSERAAYQAYYDDALRDRVAERYEGDVETFGYTFEAATG